MKLAKRSIHGPRPSSGGALHETQLDWPIGTGGYAYPPGNVRLRNRAAANSQAISLCEATYGLEGFLMLIIFCSWQSVILDKSVT